MYVAINVNLLFFCALDDFCTVTVTRVVIGGGTVCTVCSSC